MVGEWRVVHVGFLGGDHQKYKAHVPFSVGHNILDMANKHRDVELHRAWRTLL